MAMRGVDNARAMGGSWRKVDDGARLFWVCRCGDMIGNDLS